MFNSESYDRWRARIPWSDAEIAEALEAEADAREQNGNTFRAFKWRQRAESVRSGRLSKRDLTEALPRLITQCTLCGATALYRYGIEGRCRRHRDIPTDGFVHRIWMFEAKSNGIEQSQAERARKMSIKDQVKAFHAARNNRSKR